MLKIILSIGFLPFAIPESCFYQKCIGCHPQEIWVDHGSPVACHPGNWVSAEWVLNYGHPPPSTDSKVPIEYRCLKLVATPDDKSFGNTVDVIKGCIPRVQIDSVCNGLVSVERARGHSDARCFICNGNMCNLSIKIHTSLYTLISVISLYFILR